MLKIFFCLFLLFIFINSLPIEDFDDDDGDEWIDDSDDLQYDIEKFQGDIVFPEEVEDDESELSSSRNANIKAKKWENGVIPFVIYSKSKYSKIQVTKIIDAMKTIETQSNGCLRFKPKTTEKNYIVIKHTRSGCYSYVGKVGKGAQTVSLQKSGCIYKDTIIHELLHAAGFEHEQSRPDRDNYIEIQYANIQKGAASQFEKLSTTIVSTLGQPYDINSIMHYKYNAFSKNRLPTIISKVAGVKTTEIGTKTVLSPIDIIKIKLFYGCSL